MAPTLIEPVVDHLDLRPELENMEYTVVEVGRKDIGIATLRIEEELGGEGLYAGFDAFPRLKR